MTRTSHRVTPARHPGGVTGLADLVVTTLGEPRHDSPLAGYVAGRETNEHYVDEDDRVLYDDTIDRLYRRGLERDAIPSLEPGGPRRRLFFPPGATRVGIVTCGGLCPGLNDVIRGLVVELARHYGVTEVIGFRFGFAGMVAALGYDTVELDVETVRTINEQGGTILGSSRGGQDPQVMVDRLTELGIDILFVIGGDGSMRGAARIAGALREREAPVQSSASRRPSTTTSPTSARASASRPRSPSRPAPSTPRWSRRARPSAASDWSS